MAELTTQERLQPSLLDRLADDAPDVKQESREMRVISANRLREYVTRDISWLLNCVHLAATEDLEAFPHVQRSVLNFGIPDLTGVALTAVDADTLQRRVRSALLTFEPRLTPESLSIQVDTDVDAMDRRALRFRIVSEMWAQPIPLGLFLKTEVDLQTGKFEITDTAR